MNPHAARDLAEIDARYEAHIAGLHERAREAKEMLEAGVAALRDALPPSAHINEPLAPFDPLPLHGSMDVEEPPAYVAPPPNPYAGHALIPDVPLGNREADDGIPLWHD